MYSWPPQREKTKRKSNQVHGFVAAERENQKGGGSWVSTDKTWAEENARTRGGEKEQKITFSSNSQIERKGKGRAPKQKSNRWGLCSKRNKSLNRQKNIKKKKKGGQGGINKGKWSKNRHTT